MPMMLEQTDNQERGDVENGMVGNAAVAGAVGGVPNVGGTAVSGAVGGANAGNLPNVGGAAVAGAIGGATAGANAGGGNTTPNTGGGGGGGYGGGGGGSSASTVVQAGNNNAPIQNTELGDNTNYLLQEYQNSGNYEQKLEDLINTNTATLIDLANAQIDEQLKVTLAGYANELDKAKRQFGVMRAKLEQAKATEADNLALQRAASGNRGGIGEAEYNASMQQRDQALYELDLEWVNLEDQLEQAILEAQATGNYQKLANQIELTTAGFEQLTNLYNQVWQMNNANAARLDQYYEGIREFDADYNLQVQQIQQNAVLNKIQAGITVTPEDMMQFGLTGADAQTAANQINESQGIQRQLLAMELRGRASGGGYGGGSGGGGGGGTRQSRYGMSFSSSVPAAVESGILGALESDALTVTRGGREQRITLNSSGGFANPLMAGDSISTAYGVFVWDGGKWAPQGSNNTGLSSTGGGSTGSGTPAFNAAYQRLLAFMQPFQQQATLVASTEGIPVDPTMFMNAAQREEYQRLLTEVSNLR